MKYIVLSNNKEELIFTFPNSVMHVDMLEAVQTMRITLNSRDWERKFRYFECISAGFIDENNNCWGESESIGVEAREYEDTELLKRQLA